MTETKEKKIPIAVYESDHDFLRQIGHAWYIDTYADIIRELIAKYKALLATKTEA